MDQKNFTGKVGKLGTAAPQQGQQTLTFEDLAPLYKKNGESRFLPNLWKTVDFTGKLGSKVVFTDENGDAYTGLERFAVFPDWSQRPVYLYDNHYFALHAFAEISVLTGEKLSIVHIDAHRDDAPSPAKNIEPITLATVMRTIEASRICDFYDVAERGGLVREIVRITQSWEFTAFEPPEAPFVLSLDLDIFGEEGSAVPLADKMRVIRAAWMQSVAVVLATSPGFIDQQKALTMAARLLLPASS